MKCKMEENSRLFDVLTSLRKGYRSGDFEDLFPYLAEDCVLESQWVLTPNTGYEAVVSYLTGKGKTLAESEAFPECSIVELIGDCPPVRNAQVSLNGEAPVTASLGLLYDPGKLCLYMEQTLDGETHGILVDVTLDEGGKVERIDLCMPELFRYRGFYTYVVFYPTTADWDEEADDGGDPEHLVRVSESYYRELYLFLSCVGEEFDEYDDQRFSMERWLDALHLWEHFLSAKDFDEAFEAIAGVNYETGTVQDPDAAKQLGRIGKSLWEDRGNSRQMLEGLMEWTELYKGSYAFINTYGW